METLSAMWCWISLMLTLSPYTQADFATWPGCRLTTYWGERLRVLQPTTIDQSADVLHLESCRLTRIQSGSFHNSPNIRIIHLENNQIQHLEAGAFDDTTKLEEVVLSNNGLLGKNLPPNIFSNCRKLGSLRFTGNDMKDTPSGLLMGLDINILDLERCALREVPSFVTRHSLPKLVNIDMSDNQIRRLDADTFSSVPNLETLNIKNNLIEYLHENAFSPLIQITGIFLNGNKIRYLPENLFIDKSSLGTINLADNLIDHVPANAFKDTTDLWDLNLSGNRLTYLPNDFFTVLQGKMEIFYFDRNPWQCACLNEIITKVKKKDIQYEGKTFNGREPVCMMNGFRCSKPQDYPQLYGKS
ncbi:uncharacterized protein [Choristoneura fumiferana]|uniref:uncharacterized protein n=1 Tax=Choristoneura fumiferana TaxID=7141 RepID=UPI003D155DC1